MKGKLLLSVALFTVVICSIFVVNNPTIAQNYTSDFSDGEIFTPVNGQFNFKDFCLNSTDSKNFTAITISNGHTQFVDDTGNITINYIELDKMIHFEEEKTNSFLNGELEKPSWSVDGVVVHQIDFPNGSLYSAYQKYSSTNAIIYLSTPNEQQTANLMNSLCFN